MGEFAVVRPIFYNCSSPGQPARGSVSVRVQPSSLDDPSYQHLPAAGPLSRLAAIASPSRKKSRQDCSAETSVGPRRVIARHVFLMDANHAPTVRTVPRPSASTPSSRDGVEA
jgi:hypothetical protein